MATIEEIWQLFTTNENAVWLEDRANILVKRSWADQQKDVFNDEISVIDFNQNIHSIVCTANAGKWATENIDQWSYGNTDKDGNKLIVHGAGHYKAGWTGLIWKHGLHRKKYPALVQSGKAAIFADMGSYNKEDWIELYDNGGMNIHYAAGHNDVIGHGSYGCIAIKDKNGQNEWSEFMQAIYSYPDAKQFYYGALIIDV